VGRRGFGKGKQRKEVELGPIGCSEASVSNYQCTLRNILEERRSHLQRGRSLKSLILMISQFRNFLTVKNEDDLNFEFVIMWKDTVVSYV
jgi:hypothetical protein